MKQDIDKIKTWIKDTRLGLKKPNEGRVSPAVYRTFLYCVRSHYRGRLHMKIWNKDYPHELRLFDPVSMNGMYAADPLLGKMEINSLADQEKFIVHMIQYIRVQRERSEANLKAGHDWPWCREWAGLETNFDKLDDGTTVAAIP
jgi:hypothetical protein